MGKFKQPNRAWHNIVKGLGHVSWRYELTSCESSIIRTSGLSPFPYLGLSFSAGADDTLYTNIEVPVDNNGLMQVNYLSPQALLNPNNARSGSAIKKKMKKGKELDFIKRVTMS